MVPFPGYSGATPQAQLEAKAPLPCRPHDVDLTRSVANIVGWELRRGEVNLNFASVLIGKGNHRHAWVRGPVDAMRERHPSALVTDAGWPAVLATGERS